MAASTHADMHTQHRRWGADIGLWRDDIGVWQQELSEAFAELTRVGALLLAQQAALDAHRQAVNAHEQHLKGHEHALAEFESGGRGDNRLLALAKDHNYEAARHTQQGEAHERVRQQQHALMARLSPVLEALIDLA
jgi:hypothetical protein